MTGDIIKSFLVGLGFEVDDSSLAKFNKAIATASLRVTALYAAIKITTAGIVYGIAKISEGFEQIGYEYRIIAPMINKTLVMRRELLKAYAAAGINITKVVQASVKLNMSLFKTKVAFEAIYRSVASRFFGLITKQSDLLRKKLYDNMPKIQDAIERFVKFIFKAFEATVQLGSRLWSILGRVYTFFADLDKATDGWSTKILGAIAAWRLLNLSFLATPLGAVITGLLVILALFDDFKTWQEGGKSLFDWSSFVPTINAVADALGSVVKFWKELFTFHSTSGWDLIVHTFQNLLDVLTKLNNIAPTALSWAAGLAGFKISPAALGAIQSPIGVGGPNTSNTNQNVQQQTQITVQGSADANSTARAVATQQTRVNFDMVRNLKGATR